MASASAAVISPRAAVLWTRLLGLTAVFDALSRTAEIPFLLANSGWHGGTSWVTSLPAVSCAVFAEGLLGWCVWRRLWPTASAVALVVLLHLLQLRCAPASSGGDTVLRLSLLWSVLLGAYRLRPIGRYVAMAYVAQLLLMYGSSVLLKLQHPVWRDGDAACLALQADDYATPLATWLLPWCSSWLMHWPVLFVEAVVPLVVGVCVWRRAWPRLLLACVVAIAGMHLAFALTLGVWLFSWTSTLLWVPLLPLSKVFLNGGEPRRGVLLKWPTRAVSVGRARRLVVTAVIALVAVDVVSPLVGGPRPAVAQSLGLAQRWGMFARDSWDVRWPVVEVLRRDGSVVDPRRGGLPPIWGVPEDLPGSFNGVREHLLWRQAMARPPLAQRLARSFCSTPEAVAVRVVVVRRPMDHSARRLRRVLFARTMADVACTPASAPSTTSWPDWATPPPRLTLRGRPAPLANVPVDEPRSAPGDEPRDEPRDDGDAP